MGEPTLLRTPRLLIRPFEPADRAEYLRVHAESREHFRPWSPIIIRTDEEIFDTALREREDPSVWRAGAFLPDARLAAVFSLTQIFRGPFQNAYAGWRVAADQVRRGLATEGMRAVLGFALAPAGAGGLGLHRVQANVIPTNAPSLRVAEKIGMRREGLALRYLEIDGRWQDHVMFARTAEDPPWPGDLG